MPFSGLLARRDGGGVVAVDEAEKGGKKARRPWERALAGMMVSL